MASNLNSEFNYCYQVIGSTPWEKLKTLKGFLEGRKRAAALEKVAELKFRWDYDYQVDGNYYLLFTDYTGASRTLRIKSVLNYDEANKQLTILAGGCS